MENTIVQNWKSKIGVLLIAALIVSLFGSISSPSKVSASSDEFDTMRLKWRNSLIGGTGYDVNDPVIARKLNLLSQTSWSTLNKSANRTYLWSDLASTTASGHVTQSYARIKNMAIAYSTVGSTLYGDQQLKADIIGALDWMYANRYNETRAYYDNWWDWEIGSPLELNDAVVLMYDDLTLTQVTNYMKPIDRFSPVPEEVNYKQSVNTGANLVWKCNIIALRGILVKSAAKIVKARDGLSPVFDYVTVGDGFYEDGSFIQHTVFAYTGGYGTSLLQELGNVLYMLDGSTWEPVDPDASHVYQWIYDAYEPLIYNGAFMDMTRGRAIVRSYDQDHNTGHRTIAAIVRLAQLAPPEHVQRLKAMVKAWLLADTEFDYYNDVNLTLAIETLAIMNDASIQPRDELVLSKVYSGMDRAIHLRPGFGFGVSMSSNRIGTHEATVGENMTGWYTGSGMTYLYNDDQRQYYDFWPTVNKYRLPGTTVDTMARTDNEGTGYRSPKTFAGGSELLGQNSTVGMDYKAYGSSLTAKKSWFMFDDEVVALGAGINSTDNRKIETTIDNRMLNKPLLTNGVDLASPPSVPVGDEPLRHKVYAITDSANDKLLREGSIDNNFGTRWSGLGSGQWLQFDLGKVQPIGYVGISFYVQSTRTSAFDILVSEDNATWTTVFSGNSSVESNDSIIQTFDFPDVQARYVKILGYGNTLSLWNSYNEVQIYAPSAAGNLIIPPTVSPLSATSVTDVTYGTGVSEVNDYDIATFWTAGATEQSLVLDMGSDVPLGYAGIAFPDGQNREYSFAIETSADQSVWSAVYSGTSAGLTSEIRAYDLDDTTARYVRLTLHEDDEGSPGKVAEVQLYAPNALGPVLDPLHVTGAATKGDEEFIVNGVAKPVGLGWQEEMSNVSYAYLEGTGGYYFPQSATIKAQRATSVGKYSQLTTSGAATDIGKNYLTMWYDHGASPVNKDYSYVILPNKSAAETAAYGSNPDIEIVANDRNIQAVREKTTNIFGANFWQPGTVDRVTATNISSITLKDEAGALDIAVSDPTQLQTKLTFEIFREGLSVLEQDSTVTVLQLSPTIKFEVNTDRKNGHSHLVRFQYDTGVSIPLPTPSPVPPVISPTEPEPEVLTMVDILDDYTQVYARSSNLDFERNSPSYFNGDTSRAIRTNNRTTGEYLIYKAADNREMTEFDITTWFLPAEAKTDYEIYASPDDLTYTLFTPTKTTELLKWTKINYSGELPAGTKFLKIVFKLNSAYFWNSQIGEVRITSKKVTAAPPATREYTLNDPLNDFSKVLARSVNLTLEAGLPVNFNGDTSRIIRKTVSPASGEYLIYKAPYNMDMTDFDVTAWFLPAEAKTDFEIYTSPDNNVYTLFTPTKTSVLTGWQKVIYSGTLPQGTKYLKIVFRLNSAYSWNPQIGNVRITSKVPSITVTDEMNDFSHIFSRSSRLMLTGSNSAHLGNDTSRLARLSNAEEYVVYQAEPNMDLSQFTVKSWVWPYEVVDDLEFYVSPDNVTYSLFTPTANTVAKSGSWSERNYAGDLPAGNKYLKIVFKPSTTNNGWNPQIGSLSVTSHITYP